VQGSYSWQLKKRLFSIPEESWKITSMIMRQGIASSESSMIILQAVVTAAATDTFGSPDRLFRGIQ